MASLKTGRHRDQLVQVLLTTEAAGGPLGGGRGPPLRDPVHPGGGGQGGPGAGARRGHGPRGALPGNLDGDAQQVDLLPVDVLHVVLKRQAFLITFQGGGQREAGSPL